MKFVKTWLIASTFLFVTMLMLPQASHALKAKNWEGYYYGDWVYTNDTCNTGLSAEGAIYISLDDVTTKGKIKSATVYFDNNGVTYDATGKIYRKNGKNKINLNYSIDDYSLKIKGRLYKNTWRIKGKYYHETLSTGCQWGGTVDLTRYSTL